MTNSTRYNNTLVDEYYRGYGEGMEKAKQLILIEMLPNLDSSQQERLRATLEMLTTELAHSTAIG